MSSKMYDVSQGDLFIPVHDLEGPGGRQPSDKGGVGSWSPGPRRSIAARYGGLDVDRDLW